MSGELMSGNNLVCIAVLVMLLPFLPFLLLIAGYGAKKAWLPSVLIGLAFLFSAVVFAQVWNKPEVHVQLEWLRVGQVHLTAGILLNNLSVLMMLLVSGIALLVHIYSGGYMKSDGDIHKYWGYLGLFCFSMLGLVMVDSLLLIYMFWELVGFSSYLLIGFWFVRETAAQASKKAFVMNRIGDLGFLCGLAIIYTQFGTFDLVRLFGNEGLVVYSSIVDGQWIGTSGQIPAVWLSVAGLAFFAGAMAKSAQFPLHTWLPDAMEGPTSVSSLIHAATMVAAGVFLLGRIFPLFDMLTLNVIVAVGILTAFMAATIALTQNDIKRILAYSTVSQLGFMVAGMGMGLYSESIFHLGTHAFFKCLLFLAAGAVIHELHHYKEHHNLQFDHQDIREMGGLGKRMPLTMIAMCIAAAALSGLPFTSGYLSKDALIVGSFEWAGGYHGFKKWVPYIMVLTSWMTTFYIFRLIFKVFFGSPRTEDVNEPERVMVWPQIILAAFSLFVVFSINPFSYDQSWLMRGFQVSGTETLDEYHAAVPLVMNGVALMIIVLSYWLYVRKKTSVLSEKNLLYRFSNQAWYLNQVYGLVIVKSAESLAKVSMTIDRWVIDGFVNLAGQIVTVLSAVSSWFDRRIIDGFVNLTGDAAMKTGDIARRTQSGRIQQYFVAMLSFIILVFLLVYFI